MRALIPVVVLLLGCADPPPPPRGPAAYHPQALASVALKTAERTIDGRIAGNEFDDFPGLKAILKEADRNGDRTLDEGELAARFEQHRAAGDNPVPVSGTVHDGPNPVADVEVAFEPEAYYMGALAGGQATTDAGGRFVLADGLRPGLYRVTLRKSTDGRETIPARFNTATRLGAEVLGGPAFTFDLGGP